LYYYYVFENTILKIPVQGIDKYRLLVITKKRLPISLHVKVFSCIISFRSKCNIY